MANGRARFDSRTKLVAATVLYLLPVIATLYIADLQIWISISLFLIALLIATIGNYVLVYSSLQLFRSRQLTSFIDHYLELIRVDYKQQYSGNYEIRVNLMIPKQRRSVGLSGPDRGYNKQTFLQIDYRTSTYPEIELNREWGVGQGCVGKSYSGNKQMTASRHTDNRDWKPSWETTPEQDQATERVNSVFCTPIYRPSDEEQEKPVAILCLDSPEPLDQVGFDREDVQNRVTEEYAAKIGILL